jgi:hypothetical protein
MLLRSEIGNNRFIRMHKDFSSEYQAWKEAKYCDRKQTHNCFVWGCNVVFINWAKNTDSGHLTDNTLLRIIFEPKRDEVTGCCRKLHNEELHSLYSSPHITEMNKSRRMRWVEHAASMGEMRLAYKILVGNSEGKRPLGISEDGGRILLRNVGTHLQVHASSQPRRPQLAFEIVLRLQKSNTN